MIVPFELNPNLPIYKSLANAVKKSIEEGKLRVGEQMPSAREFAETLGVSKLTARRCYEVLASQGLIKSHRRGKTFVTLPFETDSSSKPDLTTSREFSLSDYGQRLLRNSSAFGYCSNADELAHLEFDELPVSRYQDCLQESVRYLSRNLITNKRDSFGLLELREQICSLLLRTRAIRCSPEQVVIFSNNHGGVDLLSRVLLNPGDIAVTEDPTFPKIAAMLSSNSLELKRCPVDAEGISIDSVLTAGKIKLLYVTPSHQDTTGLVMSKLRRYRLMQWAASSDCLIIEDDFDCEFRFGEQPQPALFSLDDTGCVVYLYNFLTSLYPLVKLSFMVLPRSMVQPFQLAMDLHTFEVPLIEQHAMASFIGKGHYERHLHKSKKMLALRRAALIHALTKSLHGKLIIPRQSGGTKLRVHFDPSFARNDIEEGARIARLSLCSTKACYRAIKHHPEFLISFAGLRPECIDAHVTSFAAYLQKSRRVIADEFGVFPAFSADLSLKATQ